MASKGSIKIYAIVAAGVLLIIAMVLYKCLAISSYQNKSQEGPLSVISNPKPSFTDPENSAVYENREPGEEKSK
ncbi:hypothetical protein NERG_01891 [Nematocida ausubeli]|uniref:Uncharacterized protein n=1 Tax=Nematocida ausubeli (strain ATCC PRA-371 / ERTm2) TaxID=1913371 RepID=H8ZE70_NEMA1|nr:hypothetical protein NERG_01891 [Nematocida ausubeli]